MRGTKVHKQIQKQIITELVCVVIYVFLHNVPNSFKYEKQGWYGGARKNMLSSLYKLEPIQVEVSSFTQW